MLVTPSCLPQGPGMKIRHRDLGILLSGARLVLGQRATFEMRCHRSLAPAQDPFMSQTCCSGDVLQWHPIVTAFILHYIIDARHQIAASQGGEFRHTCRELSISMPIYQYINISIYQHIIISIYVNHYIYINIKHIYMSIYQYINISI